MKSAQSIQPTASKTVITMKSKISKKTQLTVDNIHQNIINVQQQNYGLNNEIDIDQKKKAYENITFLQNLQKENAYFLQEIQKEKQKEAELIKQISKIENSLMDIKRQEKGGNEQQELYQKLKLLEHRLSTSKQQNDFAISDIKRLRDKINNECRERVIYDNVFKNLETDLKKNDKDLRNHISVSMAIQNKIKENQEDIQYIQKQVQHNIQSELENNYFEKEYKIIFQDNLAEKQESQLLILDSSQLKDTVRKKSTLAGNNKYDSQNQFLTKSSTKQHQNNINDFLIFMNRFKQDTDFENIEEFLTYFESMEHQNDQLYLQTNQLNDEIEKYQLKVEELSKEVVLFEKQKDLNEDDTVINESMLLQKQLDQIQLKIEGNKITRQQQLEQFQMIQVFQFIQDFLFEFFVKLREKECLTAIIEHDVLFKKKELTQMSMMHYLGMAEQKCNTINYLYNQLKSQQINQRFPKQHDLSFTSDKNINENNSDQRVSNLISQVDPIPESFKIMSRNDFYEDGHKEMKRFQMRQSKRYAKK